MHHVDHVQLLARCKIMVPPNGSAQPMERQGPWNFVVELEWPILLGQRLPERPLRQCAGIRICDH
jgi:hypothetical protein